MTYKEDSATELRVRTALELAMNVKIYANMYAEHALYFTASDQKPDDAAYRARLHGSDVGMWILVVAASVIGTKVVSVMPPVNGPKCHMVKYSSGVFQPRTGTQVPGLGMVYVMWCRMAKCQPRKMGEPMWMPNHFVPIFPLSQSPARKSVGLCDKNVGGDCGDVGQWEGGVLDVKDDNKVVPGLRGDEAADVIIINDDDIDESSDGKNVEPGMCSSLNIDDELDVWSDMEYILEQPYSDIEDDTVDVAQNQSGSNVDAKVIEIPGLPKVFTVETAESSETNQALEIGKRKKNEHGKSVVDTFTSSNEVLETVVLGVPGTADKVKSVPKRVTSSASFLVPYSQEHVTDAVGDDLGSWQNYSNHSRAYHVHAMTGEIKVCKQEKGRYVIANRKRKRTVDEKKCLSFADLSTA